MYACDTRAAQHRVHPTRGTRRVFAQFSGFKFSLLAGTVHARPAASNAAR
jgi:hypothetical protein